jgi:hypothetical protein
MKINPDTHPDLFQTLPRTAILKKGDIYKDSYVGWVETGNVAACLRDNDMIYYRRKPTK